ncbi:MAG: hypothetical protein JW991_03485 [Candidatus Pacebacteria bacterium]|nr:hypothetical protein [Candidatus Paceibacterota bacterium]
MIKEKIKKRKGKTPLQKKKPSRKKFKKVAPGVFLVFISFFLTGWIFYLFFLPKSHFSTTKEKLLRIPDNIEAQIELAAIYLENNQFSQAERLLYKIQENKDAEKQKLELKKLWEEKIDNDPREVLLQTEKWQKLLEQYPDYRDGWLKLTLLYLKLNEKEKAESAFNIARSMAPNFEVLKKIEEFF